MFFHNFSDNSRLKAATKITGIEQNKKSQAMIL